MRISKVNYYVETKNTSKKIALLTDLHYYKASDIKKLNKVYESLKVSQFDYICIAGDFIDVGNLRDIDVFINWLKKLATLKKVFVSIGGHDIVYDKKKKEYFYNDELYRKIKSINNLYLLDNDVYEDEEVRFIGLTLPLDFYYKYKENNNYFMRFVNNTFNTFDTDKYNVLLCHTPIPLTKINDYDDIKLLKTIDLVLSGHTHAGIMPKFLRGIMKGRGIFSPHKGGLFPKNSYGLIERKNFNIVISSGITKASHTNPLPFLDVFFDKEITFVNLKRRLKH